MRFQDLAAPLLAALALALFGAPAVAQQGTGEATEVQQPQQAPQAPALGTQQGVDMRRLSVEDTNRLLGTADREIGRPAEVLTLTPGDIVARDVVTMDGEEVGSVGEIVATGGQLYAIVEHGGFLGIGEDRVSIPLERIGLRGENVILLGLTEQQLEQMPDYDYATDETVAADRPIEIGRYE